MAVLAGQRVLLGVTGGIAAYKSADLVRRLREAGAEVRVVMTEGARHFITATTLQALSGYPVRDSLWDESAEAAMGHIELARWATRIVIAPASANALAKLAQNEPVEIEHRSRVGLAREPQQMEGALEVTLLEGGVGCRDVVAFGQQWV